MIISLFETVRLSVSISPRNLYNSLKSIKEDIISLTLRLCYFNTVTDDRFMQYYAILPQSHLMTEIKVIDFANVLLKCLLKVSFWNNFLVCVWLQLIQRTLLDAGPGFYTVPISSLSLTSRSRSQAEYLQIYSAWMVSYTQAAQECYMVAASPL